MSRIIVVIGLGFCLGLHLTQPAAAQLAIERVIVDFVPDSPRRNDVELSNTSDRTLYVEIAPRLVKNPGTETEERVRIANPRELGLLATPTKLVLEPGQRSLLRLSLLGRPRDADRIYRVGVTPKVGRVQAEQTGLKVLVAYNMLVIARPPDARARIESQRSGRDLTLRNVGNSNALLVRGEQCDAAGNACQRLPSQRLYAGNVWRVELPYADTPAVWQIQDSEPTRERRF